MICELWGFQAGADDILVGQLVTRAFYTKTSEPPRSTPRLGRWSCATQDLDQQGRYGPWYPPFIHLHSNEACYCQTQRSSSGKAAPTKLSSHKLKRNHKSIATPARTRDRLEIYSPQEGSPTPPDNTKLHHAPSIPPEPYPRPTGPTCHSGHSAVRSTARPTTCRVGYVTDPVVWPVGGIVPGTVISGPRRAAGDGGVGRGGLVFVGLCEVLVLVWDAVVSDELDDFVRVWMAWG